MTRRLRRWLSSALYRWWLRSQSPAGRYAEAIILTSARDAVPRSTLDWRDKVRIANVICWRKRVLAEVSGGKA